MTDWAIALRDDSTLSPSSGSGPGRRWPRRALIAVLTVIAVVATTIAGITYPWHSVATPPERLLQAVNVDLGTDGRVAGITTTNVHQSAKQTTHDTVRLSPSGDVTSLPVRVELGYVLDGQAGKNLNDVVGKSGTIEVDVTVTNQTQNTQLISYTDPAGIHQQYAPVAAPMTVVGTVTLPAGSYTALATPVADPTGRGDNTSGVVHPTDGGDTSVQWATVLAPPLLASQTTFRLVETTTNFQLPHFTVAAQPGLVTDPSTTQLLAAAFAKGTGTDAGQLLDLERATVTRIDTLRRQLADTAGQLGTVKNSLFDSGGQPARQAAAKLAATNTTLRASTSALAATLSQLDTSMTDTLGPTKSSAKQQLDDEAKVVVDYLGVGTVKDPAPPRLAQDCKAAELNNAAQPKTLLGELGLVSSQAKALAGATAGCAGVLSAALDNVIGSVDTKDCTTSSRTLVCALDATSTALASVPGDIDRVQEQIFAGLDPSYHATVADDIQKLAKAVAVAQAGAESIRPVSGPGSTRALKASIAQVRSQVGVAMQLLDSGLNGLGAHVSAVHDAAVADLAALAPGGGSIADQIAELDARICNPPSDMSSGLDADYVAVLNSLVSDGDCGGSLKSFASDGAYGTPLNVRFANLRYHLSSLIAQTNVSAVNPTGIAADFAPLKTRLSSIQSDLDTLSSNVGKGAVITAGTVAGTLATVVRDLNALYDAKSSSASCTKSSAAAPPVNALTQDFASLTCHSNAGVADVKALLGHLKAAKKSGSGAGSGSGSDTGSVAEGEETVDSLVAGLSAALQARGARPVDPGLRQGVAAIDAAIGSADDVQAVAVERLRQLVARVLDYLGPTGGVISSTTDKSDATALVRAQIRQGMKQVSALPAFATQQPGGSSHLTVYLFTLGAG